MKKTGKKQMLKGLLLTLVLTFGIFVWSSDSVISLAASTAKVVANSGMVRAKADKNSDVVGSVKKGDSLEVISSENDGAGYTWYKVYVDSQKTGYIRGDLVTVEGDVSEGGGSVTVVGSNKNTKTTTTTVGSNNSQTTTVVESDNSQETTAIQESNVETTDVATAKVTTDVRVRKGPGTNFDVAAQAKGGIEVTVSGVAADSEGKNWYQVSYQDGSKSVNGFIREDFLEVLSRVETPEEEPVVEEPAVEEIPAADNQDYQLQYTQNSAGEMDWFLIDNVHGTSQSLTQMLNAIAQIEENELVEDGQVSTMYTIFIAMAVVIVVLIVTVTILIFKLRDSYEYEYEDDDEDEEDDEEDEDDEDEDDEDEPEKTSRKPRFGFMKKKEEVEEDFDEDEEDEETLEEIQPVEPKKNKKTEAKTWQSKDFLELDDDMEFEFLDL